MTRQILWLRIFVEGVVIVVSIPRSSILSGVLGKTKLSIGQNAGLRIFAS